MMAGQNASPRGQLFIPPCKNSVCHLWIDKLNKCLKSDLECVTKLKIKSSFLTQFKHHFQECDLTIIHFCPYLWKRVSKIENFLSEKNDKLILVNFTDDRLTESFAQAGEEDNCSVNTFFEDFDNVQVIRDDGEALQSFKDEVLSCLSENENADEGDVADDASHRMLESTYIKELDMENDYQEEEEDEGDVVNYEKYPDFFSNSKSLLVGHSVSQYDGHKDIPFSNTDIASLKKIMQQINQLGDRLTREEMTSTWKYILFEVIPDLYEKGDMVRLASFSMCRHSFIQERAMDSLELLLWEKVDQVQSFKILNYVQEILTAALMDLKIDYNEMKEKCYLTMLQRLANLCVVVMGLLLIQTHENPNMSTACYHYFKTRIESPFVPKKPDLKSAFELKNQFEADVCLSVIDIVVKTAGDCKHKSAEKILHEKPENLYGAVKKSMAVHLTVVVQLLLKVFSLDESALHTLVGYTKEAKDKSPFVFTILHSLTLFLAHKTQKIAHKDLKMICKTSVLVIQAAIPHGQANQVDSFLQRLLFNSNGIIRGEVIKLFMKTDRYELMSQYLPNEMEQRLSPLLANFEGSSNGFLGESRGQFGWKKASGKFNNLDVWIYYYSMNEKDHKDNKTDFSDKDPCYTEMTRLASLQHKNIIKMFVYQSECVPQFYVTENCEQNLQGHLKNKWKNKNNSWCTPSQLLQFLVDAVTALKYCHKKGYVHCNLTAESLIVVDETHVKLAGFGLCKTVNPETEKAHDINSKHIPIRWSAPESILRGDFSKASDIWMVGHLLYEVMTHGLPPYWDLGKEDAEIIELMKSKRLRPTIDPVGVERESLLQLLGQCTSYDERGRTSAANVKATLENILNRVKTLPAKPVVLPKGLSLKNVLSNCKRGVPKEFHKETKVNFKGKINIGQNLDRYKEDDEFIFIEKITHELSASMETSFQSPILDNILPQERDIVQKSSEMKFIECRIPSEICFSLQDVALNKRVKDVGQIIFFMNLVASKLVELSKHGYAIGDICASHVYAELTDTPQVHIISLKYLRTISSGEELSPTAHELITRSYPEHAKRRASPEVIQYGRFSAASDVFCFGNFMWEMLAAFSREEKQTSVFFNKGIEIFRSLQVDKICDAILSGKWENHHPRPKLCPDGLYELIKSCVSAENERPTMDHVAVKLREYCRANVDETNTIYSDTIGTNTEANHQSNRNSATLSVANPSSHSGSTTSSVPSDTSGSLLRIRNPSSSSSSNS